MQTTPGNPLILESAAIEVTHLQTEKLTGLSNLPNIESLRWKATGEIPLLQPLNARFTSDLEVRTITYTPSAKGRVDGRATLPAQSNPFPCLIHTLDPQTVQNVLFLYVVIKEH